MSELSYYLCGKEEAPFRGQLEVFYTDSEQDIRQWWPILFNLSSLSSHAHIDVRTAALDALFKTLNECGGSFSEQLWTIVFAGVLGPIFDNARQHTAVSAADNEWLSTTALKAFQYLVSVFHLFFSRISFLLPEYLELLSGCVDGNETLAQYGSTCFLTLVLDNKDLWSPQQYTSISRALLHMFKASCTVLLRPVPLDSVFTEAAVQASTEDQELLRRLEREAAIAEPAPANVRTLKVSVLLMLVRVVSSLADGVLSHLSPTDMTILLDALSFSYICVRQSKLSDEKLRIRAELDSVEKMLELMGKAEPRDTTRITAVTCDLLNELNGTHDAIGTDSLGADAPISSSDQSSNQSNQSN